MTKWEYIRNITRAVFSNKKAWKLETGHSVEVAFYSGGVPHYRITDTFNTYAGRGFEAYQVYEEVTMRMDNATALKYVEKIEKEANSNPIKMTEIIKFIGLLKERLALPLPPRELIYRLAAVAYFDANESPYSYDHVYCEKKIERWKKNGDVDDFFLSQRLKDLIPLPELSKETYQTLQETIEKMMKHHLKQISGNHLPKQKGTVTS